MGIRVAHLGLGKMGYGIADNIRSAGFDITVWNRSPEQAQEFVRGGGRLAATPADAVAEADVVVIAVPLTPQTEGMVDEAFVKRMRDGALLVNVARGSVVKTEALLAELPRIEAALDVVDPEPLPAEHPLWTAPGVLITPHIGGDSDAFPRLARRLIADQVRRWRGGEPLVNVIVGS